MKPKRKKKKSPQDSTMRNVRAANHKIEKLHKYFMGMELFCVNLLDILKSKRLLTPSQIRMLEDCLR